MEKVKCPNCGGTLPSAKSAINSISSQVKEDKVRRREFTNLKKNEPQRLNSYSRLLTEIFK
jgi:hypothetical protein